LPCCAADAAAAAYNCESLVSLDTAAAVMGARVACAGPGVGSCRLASRPTGVKKAALATAGAVAGAATSAGRAPGRALFAAGLAVLGGPAAADDVALLFGVGGSPGGSSYARSSRPGDAAALRDSVALCVRDGLRLRGAGLGPGGDVAGPRAVAPATDDAVWGTYGVAGAWTAGHGGNAKPKPLSSARAGSGPGPGPGSGPNKASPARQSRPERPQTQEKANGGSRAGGGDEREFDNASVFPVSRDKRPIRLPCRPLPASRLALRATSRAVAGHVERLSAYANRAARPYFHYL
jgi:hypothetical protein